MPGCTAPVRLVDVAARVSLAYGRLEQENRPVPFSLGDGILGLAEGVFVGEPGNLLGPGGRGGLVLLEQGQCFVLVGRSIPDHLRDRVGDSLDLLPALRGIDRSGRVGHLGVEVLGQLEQNSEPFLGTQLVALGVGLEPRLGHVGGEDMLLALGQRADVIVRHDALESVQPRVGMFQETLVDPDRFADLPLLLVAFCLPHLGG